jgi:hypothetical protein
MKGIVAKASAASVMASVLVLSFCTGAFADVSDDPLNGATAGIKDALVSFIETNLVPLIIAFLVIGVAMGLVIRWARKSRSVATP